MELSSALVSLHLTLERVRGPKRLEPFAGGFGVLRPEKQGEFASANGNYIWIDGSVGASMQDIARMEEIYRDAKVPIHFAWLTPGGAASDGLAAQLAERGWLDYERPEYFALARESGWMERAADGLTLRWISAEEVRDRADEFIAIQGKSDAGTYFVTCAGKPGFDHVAAFDGEKPVAAALNFTFGQIAWLGFGATLPEYRNRGAQTALIAARVGRAFERGTPWCLSETLSILGTSLNNLKRGGFGVVDRFRVLKRTSNDER